MQFSLLVKYETEYKANFRTPDLQQGYLPPKLKPRGFEKPLPREGLLQQPDSPPVHYNHATDSKKRHGDPPVNHRKPSKNVAEHARIGEDRQVETETHVPVSLAKFLSCI